MRIAVDARTLNYPLTGIGRYTYNVLKQLLTHQEHKWFIYSETRIQLDLPDGEHIQYRYLEKKWPLFSSLYSQLVFPAWARKDAVDGFWSPGQHLPLLLPSKIKAIVTMHDLVWHRYPETMSKRARLLDQYLIPASLNKADHILSVSGNTRNELINVLGISPQSITVTHLAPSPLPAGQEPVLLPELQDTPFILFVGTLEPRKNLNHLLKAYAKLINKYPNYKLVICGLAGWLDTPLQNILAELNLEERVIITGYVSEQQLHGLYQHTRVLAMPSLYEGFGLPALEAMAYQKPVVVTPETEINQFESALINRCPDCGVDSIYSALDSALSSPDKYGKPLPLNWQATSAKTLQQLARA